MTRERKAELIEETSAIPFAVMLMIAVLWWVTASNF